MLPTGSTLPAPPGMDLFPVERVLLLAAEFPPMTAAQRRAAAPFAVEERIASPLEAVHVALVAPLTAPVQGAGQTWLLAVVSLEVIAGLPDRSARGRRLIPDVLCLPRPAPGEWSVFEAGGRMLVRLPDGTGLALQSGAFGLAHRLAGLPGIVLYGGDPGALEQAAHRPADLPGGTDPVLDGFDLWGLVPRQRPLATPRLRRIAAVAAVAGIGHVAIAGTDAAALSAVLQVRREALEQVASLAGLPTSVTPTEVLAARDSAAAPRTGPRPVLPMIARAVGALEGVSGGVSLREMRYQGSDRALTLVVQGADLAALQAAGAALTLEGLVVEAGPAVNDGGLAEQTLTLRAGPP